MEILNFNEINRQLTTWLDDPKKFVYVRKAIFHTDSPNGKPDISDIPNSYRLIGYTNPKEFVSGCYQGEFYYLKDYDTGMPKEHYKKNRTPSEAVQFI